MSLSSHWFQRDYSFSFWDFYFVHSVFVHLLATWASAIWKLENFILLSWRYRCGLDTSLRFTFCANARFTLFFFFFWHAFSLAKLKVRLLFMHCSWTVAALFDFSTHFQPHQWVSCTVHGTHRLYFP